MITEFLRKWGALCGILLFASCSSNSTSTPIEEPDVPVEEVKKYYTNPVLGVSVPDPTAIRANDGFTYLYGTEDIYNMPIFRSMDMINWTQVGTVFTPETRPVFPEKTTNLWAPEIRYMKGKYVIFYSMSAMNLWMESTIGYAVADKASGPFIPKGYIVNGWQLDAQNGGGFNCIDEYIYEESGRYYMIVGSFCGLTLFELNVADDLTITPKKMAGSKVANQKIIAGRAYEAAVLYKRYGYYYLFASVGSFGIEGGNSSYQTVVGRSENMYGPYVAKDGRKMTDNQHEWLIAGDLKFTGTGHNSALLEDERGNTWTLYHGYSKSNLNKGRQVFLDRIYWDEQDWPYVDGGHPAGTAEIPVIKK